jgi:hypothetical protein
VIEGIRREAERRGITRLCHFTPSRNLISIARGETGVLATRHLRADEQAVFTPTDLLRLDRHEDYVCCSIQYPNAWFLEKAREREWLFRDWIIILISPSYLWMSGTRFSPRNAAAASGRGITEGEDAFKALFAPQVRGAYDRIYWRSATHLPECPTDEQAEVLVPDRIDFRDILGVVVRDEAQAKNERVRIELDGTSNPRFAYVVAPDFFNPRGLSANIRNGRRPEERMWTG